MATPRLPLAPRPSRDEALSSWIARVAARYDVTGDGLVAHLLPGESDAAAIARWIDHYAWPPLEGALAEAAGLPMSRLTGQRLPGLAGRPDAAWPRWNCAWCPYCTAADVAAQGETYLRREWMFGGTVMCPQHHCLLSAACPLCSGSVALQPVDGRLRLWCDTCDDCADSDRVLRLAPFWPYEPPRQSCPCVTIQMDDATPRLLWRIQRDLFAIMAGERPRGPWTRALKWRRIFAVMRGLSFVMLGPLWADDRRTVRATELDSAPRELADNWTPGALSPDVAAASLAAAATFLAAESGTRLRGITWNPRLLIRGESAVIEARSLLWHLTAADARLVRTLFERPLTRPFLVLLEALRRDRHQKGALREKARRRQGVGGADRRRWAYRGRLRRETDPQRQERAWWEHIYQNPTRFSIGRLNFEDPWWADLRAQENPSVGPPRPRYTSPSVMSEEEPAPVYSLETLLKEPAIRSWSERHTHIDRNRLIRGLSVALGEADYRKRPLILPELRH